MNHVNQYKSSTKLEQEEQYRQLRTYWDIEEDAIKFVEKIYSERNDVRSLWNTYSLETGQRAQFISANDEIVSEIKNVKRFMQEQFLTGAWHRNKNGNLEVVPEDFSQEQKNKIAEDAAIVEQLLITWDHKSTYINPLNGPQYNQNGELTSDWYNTYTQFFQNSFMNHNQN